MIDNEPKLHDQVSGFASAVSMSDAARRLTESVSLYGVILLAPPFRFQILLSQGFVAVGLAYNLPLTLR